MLTYKKIDFFLSKDKISDDEKNYLSNQISFCNQEINFFCKIFRKLSKNLEQQIKFFFNKDLFEEEILAIPSTSKSDQIFGKIEWYEVKSLKKSKFNQKNKKILLKYKKGKTFIWQSEPEKIGITDEKPLVLDFDGQDFYFYSTGLTISRQGWRNNWISFHNRLNPQEQALIIDKLTEITDPKDLYKKYIILELKYPFIKKLFIIFDEKWSEIKRKLPPNDNFQKEVVRYLNNKIINYKNQIERIKKLIDLLRKEVIYNKYCKLNEVDDYFLIEKIDLYDQELNVFSKFLICSTKNLENQIMNFNSKNLSIIDLERKLDVSETKTIFKEENENNKVILINSIEEELGNYNLIDFDLSTFDLELFNLKESDLEFFDSDLTFLNSKLTEKNKSFLKDFELDYSELEEMILN